MMKGICLGKKADQKSSREPAIGRAGASAFASFKPENEKPSSQDLERVACFSHHFAEIDILPRPFVQPKLVVAPPGDKYEQEADRVAEQVMQMPEPCPKCQPEDEDLLAKPISHKITQLIQRQETGHEEVEDEVEEEEKFIQPKRAGGLTSQLDSDLNTYVRSMRSIGQPLSESTRNFFEQRFCYNFSHVRVHTDSKASKIARALNAKAFAVGQNIVFGSTYYKPETIAGKKLLAHELTHIVQKNGSFSQQNQMNLVNRVPDDNYENEYTLSLDYNHDFEVFQQAVIDLISWRVMRSRAPLLVRQSNLSEVHRALENIFGFRTNQRVEVLHASFTRSGARVERILFRIEWTEWTGREFETERIRANRSLYDILNDPWMRNQYWMKYRRLAIESRRLIEESPPISPEATGYGYLEKEMKMGMWIMHHWTELRFDTDPMLRRWFRLPPRRSLERIQGESEETYQRRIDDQVQEYIHDLKERYSRILDRYFIECQEGCTPEGEEIAVHIEYLREHYGSEPF